MSVTNLKKTSHVRQRVAIFVGIGGLTLAALVLIGQLYVWFKTGHWPDLSLATLVAPIISGSKLSAWLDNPQSWYVLHLAITILIGLPLWVWILCCATVAMFVLKKD